MVKIMYYKTCTKCKKEVPATPKYFHRDNSSKSGLHSQCKECRNLWRKNNKEKYKKWREKNKEKIRENQRKYYRNDKKKYRENRIKNLFGITLKDYNEMLKKQNGRCAICGTKKVGRNQYNNRSLGIDHDHKTGKIRGLLCNNCNTTLGFLKDNPLILIKAVKYLQKYS